MVVMIFFLFLKECWSLSFASHSTHFYVTVYV